MHHSSSGRACVLRTLRNAVSAGGTLNFKHRAATLGRDLERPGFRVGSTPMEAIDRCDRPDDRSRDPRPSCRGTAARPTESGGPANPPLHARSTTDRDWNAFSLDRWRHAKLREPRRQQLASSELLGRPGGPAVIRPRPCGRSRVLPATRAQACSCPRTMAREANSRRPRARPRS